MEGNSSKVREESPLCINDALPYHLLVEVLLRIPPVYVFRCSSVCELWYYVLKYDLDFIRRFILQRVREQTPSSEDTKLINEEWNRSEIVMLTPTSYCHSASQFSLDFIPFDDTDPFCETLSHVVKGSSNGLLLCTRPKRHYDSYYICNPVTWHWLELPRFPPRPNKGHAQVGFVSDPFYLINEDGQSIAVNREFRVKVVLLYLDSVDEISLEIDVDIFSSHTGCWTSSKAQLPDYVNKELDEGPSTLDNGRMYWMLKGGCEFLVYDINTNEFALDYLQLPSTASDFDDDGDDDDYFWLFKGLCQCQGSLWAVLATFGHLITYELLDSKWCLKHDVHLLHDMQYCSSSVKKRLDMLLPDSLDFFTMHPNDPMVAYMGTWNYLFECNFGDRTIRLIIEIVDLDDDPDDNDPDDDPDDCPDNDPDDDPDDGLPTFIEYINFYVLPLSLPLWPTPLPLLPQLPPPSDSSADFATRAKCKAVAFQKKMQRDFDLMADHLRREFGLEADEMLRQKQSEMNSMLKEIISEWSTDATPCFLSELFQGFYFSIPPKPFTGNGEELKQGEEEGEGREEEDDDDGTKV